MFAAVEWAKPGTTDPVGEKPMAFPAAIASRALEKGLILRALWECTAVSPPLCTTREEIDEIVGILVEAVDEASP